MPSRDLCKIHEGMFDKPEGLSHIPECLVFCTIVASKIKGTLQGKSLYTPQVGIQGKSLQVKPLRLHTVNSIDCGRNFGRAKVGSG